MGEIKSKLDYSETKEEIYEYDEDNDIAQADYFHEEIDLNYENNQFPESIAYESPYLAQQGESLQGESELSNKFSNSIQLENV